MRLIEGMRAMAVEPLSLLRLEKNSLRQQALTALRRAITSGELPPGMHLVETELSDTLQISRGTLREAMRQLQQEGLISATGDRGRLSVRHLDAKEIKDIFRSARRWNRWPPVNCARCPIAPPPSQHCATPSTEMERWAAPTWRTASRPT